MREIKGDLNKWRHILYLWIRKLNTVKLSVLSKAIDSIQSQSKFQQGFFRRNSIKMKESKIAKTTLEKKNKVGGPTLPAFNAYSKATVLKTVRYWHEDRQRDQWSRIKNPEIDSRIYG